MGEAHGVLDALVPVIALPAFGMIVVLTAPACEVSRSVAPPAAQRCPDLLRGAAVPDAAQAARFAELGLRPVVDAGEPTGRELAAAVLAEMGVGQEGRAEWRAGRPGLGERSDAA